MTDLRNCRRAGLACDSEGRSGSMTASSTPQAGRSPRRLRTCCFAPAHARVARRNTGQGVRGSASFVRGLSVRDVEAALAEALGDQAAISKSSVCGQIKDEYQAWASRRLDGITLDYLYLDASFFRMHPGSPARRLGTPLAVRARRRRGSARESAGRGRVVPVGAGWDMGHRGGDCGLPAAPGAGRSGGRLVRGAHSPEQGWMLPALVTSGRLPVPGGAAAWTAGREHAR